MSSSAKNKKLIFGIKAVKELIENRPDLVKKIIISRDNQHLKKEFGIQFIYNYWTKDQFDKTFPRERHQRSIAVIKEFKPTPWIHLVDEVKFESKRNNLILILDRIQDPQNYGLLIRTAVAAGIRYIIVPKKGQCSINATVAKVSAGNLFSMKIIESDNLIRTIELLKNLDFTIITTNVSKGEPYDKLNIENKNVALIVGNENDGVSKELIKKTSKTINVPMKKAESLNVAIATSIIIFDIRRQQKFWN